MNLMEKRLKQWHKIKDAIETHLPQVADGYSLVVKPCYLTTQYRHEPVAKFITACRLYEYHSITKIQIALQYALRESAVQRDLKDGIEYTIHNTSNFINNFLSKL